MLETYFTVSGEKNTRKLKPRHATAFDCPSFFVDVSATAMCRGGLARLYQCGSSSSCEGKAHCEVSFKCETVLETGKCSL